MTNTAAMRPTLPAFVSGTLAFAMAFALCRPAAAKTRRVVGGAVHSTYVFSGSQDDNILNEGIDHDVRFLVAAVAAAQRVTASHDLQLAAVAGALIAARFSDFRNAYVKVLVNDDARPNRRTTLSSRLAVDLSPISSAVRSGRQLSTTGDLALDVTPAFSATFALSRRHQIAAAAVFNGFWLLGKRDSLDDGTVSSAMSLTPEISWTTRLDAAQSVSARALVRYINATAARVDENVTPPKETKVTADAPFVGGLLGYGRKFRKWTTSLQGGIGAVASDLAPHLAPVEPLLRLRGSYQHHHDSVDLVANWTVQQNNFFGGLPMRSLTLSADYLRAPSYSPLNFRAGVSYDYTRFGFVDNKSTLADDVHTVRLSGRIAFRVLDDFRLRFDAQLAYGAASLGQPNSCGENGNTACANTGFYAAVGFGIAYLRTQRPRDERLVSEVW